jgi:hypothetical protein
MSNERIQTGFQVFTKDGNDEFGAVREVRPGGRAELVIFVENGGEFVVPIAAVHAVHAQKVVLDPAHLDKKLLAAIAHAHDAETE